MRLEKGEALSPLIFYAFKKVQRSDMSESDTYMLKVTCRKEHTPLKNAEILIRTGK